MLDKNQQENNKAHSHKGMDEVAAQYILHESEIKWSNSQLFATIVRYGMLYLFFLLLVCFYLFNMWQTIPDWTNSSLIPSTKWWANISSELKKQNSFKRI